MIFRNLFFSGIALLLFSAAVGQSTFPVNGVSDLRNTVIAFVKATIQVDAQTVYANGTLLIQDGKILAVGSDVTIPAAAVVIDCQGKFIYPSFIDLYSDYGLPAVTRQASAYNYLQPAQFTSNQKGAYGWNQAIRTDVDASRLFTVDESRAKTLRDVGFGTVLSHQKDGIARGTGVIVTLANQKENQVILKERASAHYSLNKGSSQQSYPSSMMGSIALLRQTYLDAAWYKGNPVKEGVNLTLKYWNEQQSFPQIFEANDKWNDLRADRIGDEFGVQYIIKGGQNEYQRIKDIKATRANYILPLNFPSALDVDDPAELRFIAVDELKHWELAPTSPAAFEKAEIPFSLTTADLSTPQEFTGNLKKAIDEGLSVAKALDALTKNPASWLGIYDQVGSLNAGKLANFIITSGRLFQEKTVIYQNWVQGEKYVVKEEGWQDSKGTYTLQLNGAKGAQTFSMQLKEGGSVTVLVPDTLTGKYDYDGKLMKINYTQGKGAAAADVLLSGYSTQAGFEGSGRDVAGNPFTWKAKLEKPFPASADSTRPAEAKTIGKVTYPFLAYGFEQRPAAENLLIKNTTVWTNEAEGVLTGTDVLIKNGKIVKIGTQLSDTSARLIDGTGKHLTAGIIDEHSHIAAASINEGAQSVTSEVRIADNLNPDDINIYRQLSGGVTSSHILHGSANTIGGQTQLIKLRWGANDEELKFAGADPFIKFALGENVKRTSVPMGNNRFPDTRMGVEQVLVDAFTRAVDYQREMSQYAEATKKSRKATPGVTPRKDLELEALAEILNKKRFITCHSYVQSEITSAMRVAERFGIRVNTFTHILEGYKVADKMKAHGANASTFSDWWNYKMEVIDAIPANPAIMQAVGLNVAINSDDAEMARRLNQEAAKSVKYGGVKEEDAWKMVTLNPARMLHVDSRVGSIKVGKDADLVLWSDHPLSIYAQALKTIVDGVVYFDRDRDRQLRQQVQEEKNRLIQKMAAAKKKAGAGGGNESFRRPRPRYEILQTCSDHYHRHGLLSLESDEQGLQ